MFDKYAYNDQYRKDHYDRIEISTPKGQKKRIQAAAKNKGMSVNWYINRSIDKALKSD